MPAFIDHDADGRIEVDAIKARLAIMHLVPLGVIDDDLREDMRLLLAVVEAAQHQRDRRYSDYERAANGTYGAGFGATALAGAELAHVRLQAAVKGTRTNGQHLTFNRGRNRPVVFGPGQPQGQEGFEAHRPGIARGFPDDGEDGEGGGLIGEPARAPTGRRARWRTGEEANGGFAVTAEGGADLGEDLPFGLSGSWSIAEADGRKVLAFGRWARGRAPRKEVSFGNSFRGATIGPSVTLYAARFVRLPHPQTRVIL